MRHLVGWLMALAPLLLSACGGSVIDGFLLEPPPASESLVTSAMARGLPPIIDLTHIVPAQVRAYPRKYIVVDLVVVVTERSIEPVDGMAGEFGVPPGTADRASWIARYFTNGIMFGNSNPSIRVSRGEERVPIYLSRPVVHSVTEEPEWEYFQFGTRANVAVVPFEHNGRRCWGCVVPITLATNRPPSVGEVVSVRLAGDRYNVDSRTFEFVVVEASTHSPR
jgi:hypothetical protein